MSGVGLRPRPIEIGRIFSKVNVGRFHRDVVPSTADSTLGDCYQISNTLHRMFGMTTCISNPGKVDIWHATSPLPIKGKKTRKITTIHDIIPLRLPHMTAEDKKAFFMNIHNSIRDSDLIMCDSEKTKTDVMEFFDVDPDRLHVVYLPIALDVRWQTRSGFIPASKVRPEIQTLCSLRWRVGTEEEYRRSGQGVCRNRYRYPPCHGGKASQVMGGRNQKTCVDQERAYSRLHLTRRLELFVCWSERVCLSFVL